MEQHDPIGEAVSASEGVSIGYRANSKIILNFGSGFQKSEALLRIRQVITLTTGIIRNKRIGVSCGKRETNVHTSILGVRTGAYAPILKGKIFLP